MPLLLRTLELSSLALFGACSILSNVAAGVASEPLLNFGALGLVAFMVIQNYRQSKELTAANVQLSRALGRIAEALEDRPCLHGDTRISGKEK